MDANADVRRDSRRDGTHKIDRHLFGLFLEAKRIVRGIGRAELARQARVTPDTVRLVMDRRPIPRTCFLKLCRWQGEDPKIFRERKPA